MGDSLDTCSVDLEAPAPSPFSHAALVLETLTRAGLLDSMSPERLFVSVQDAAAHALERLVRRRSLKSGSQEMLG